MDQSTLSQPNSPCMDDMKEGIPTHTALEERQDKSVTERQITNIGMWVGGCRHTIEAICSLLILLDISAKLMLSDFRRD